VHYLEGEDFLDFFTGAVTTSSSIGASLTSSTGVSTSIT
jgi:hypothetical protein